jgi:hypothetical protein
MVKRIDEIKPGTDWPDGRTVKGWHVTDTTPSYVGGRSQHPAIVEFTNGDEIEIVVEQ